ncbi:hypothetical protein CEXT_315811 [Caerostris extrusa]|uniref:Uncharacterized protein n=1 Tax=Caerostris extrusa TaxID=172846 RepID=A0AAV4NQR5_CAEEX|nr:hypothetical protein CEXT_315811 [Caerostris extrusa]
MVKNHYPIQWQQMQFDRLDGEGLHDEHVEVETLHEHPEEVGAHQGRTPGTVLRDIPQIRINGGNGTSRKKKKKSKKRSQQKPFISLLFKKLLWTIKTLDSDSVGKIQHEYSEGHPKVTQLRLDTSRLPSSPRERAGDIRPEGEGLPVEGWGVGWGM